MADPSVQPRRLSTPTPPPTPTGTPRSPVSPSTLPTLIPYVGPISNKPSQSTGGGATGEFKAGSKAGVLGQIRDVASREAQATGKVVQNVPAGTARFFGGLAVDFTWGLARSIISNGPMLNIGPEYVPKTTNEAVDSFLNTAKVWERIPDYWDTIQAGQAIIPMLLEDIGNLSIVFRGFRVPTKAIAASATKRAATNAARAQTSAGVAAAQAATRAARLSTIASRANKVTNATNRVIYYSDKAGTYPFMPYVWAGKGLGKAIREGVYVEGVGGWGAQAAKGYLNEIEALRQAEPDIDPADPRLTDLTTKAARNLRLSLSHSTRQQIRQAVRNSQHEQAAVERKMLDIKQNPLLKDEINPATGEVWGELTPIEEQAIISVLNGRAALIKGLSERLGIEPERVAELGKYDETPEYWLSPQGARLAMDFVEGRLTPEHYDRLSQALNNLAEYVVLSTQKAVEGYGRRNLLSPDYLVPLPFINKLKSAVMQTKNRDLIELWVALEEAGLLIPLSEALETFDPQQLKLREEALVAFVQNLPDELALDPSMYPANMRENVEFYRRVRRSFNQRATGAADKTPVPDVDGGPRAPVDPFFPFDEAEDLGIEAPTGPEQFPMTRGRGKIDAAETRLGKAKETIEKLREKVIEIADKIADLEVKEAKLIERVRKYDIVDLHLSGMTSKAIARRFWLPVAEVEKIIKKSQLVNVSKGLQTIDQRLAELQKVIGVKRASLPEGAMDAELASLMQQARDLLTEAENARKAVEAAESMNTIARLADESAIERLTEEMDLAEDQLLDGEAEYENAGGDIEDLRADVDPRDPEVGPVTPELAEAYLNNLTALVEDVTMKMGEQPIAETVTRTVTVLNQAWNQAIDFYESAATDTQVTVGELRLQQLGDMIADLTETINTLITEAPEGVQLEQVIIDNLVQFVNDPNNQAIISGTAPFASRTGSKFVTLRPLVQEGKTFNENIGTDYLPAFNPEDVAASFLADVNATFPIDTPEVWLLPKSAARTIFYDDAQLRVFSDGSFSFFTETSDGRGEFGINIASREAVVTLPASEIYKKFDELVEDVQNQLDDDSDYVYVEIEGDFGDGNNYFTLEFDSKKDGYLTYLEDYEKQIAKVIGPRDAVIAAEQPRLRAVDEMVEAGAPLPDPEAEAIAQNIAADDVAFNDEAINTDVENYRYVTQKIEELRNPTPEAIEAYRTQAVEAARQELDTSLGLLENLGGQVTGDNVTFRINVRRGTPEWEWWEQLDPNVRRNIARKYFRSDKIKSTAAKGPRTVQQAFNVDQFASEVNLDVEQWADQFLEGIRLHEQAQRNLREAKSGDIDTETFIRENQELQEALSDQFKLEEQDINQELVDIYDRAATIRAERQDADIPNDPAEVRPDPTLVDPLVRAAAYEADLLVSMSKEATTKMRRAERAQDRLKAFEEYIKQSGYRKIQVERMLRLQNVGKKARLSLEKNIERQRKKREEQRGVKNEIRNLVAMENRLVGDESFDLATNMPGALPLEIALEGGYPAEQFSVDVPLGPRDARTVEPVTLQGPMYLPTGRPRPFTGGLRTEVLEAGLPGFDRLSSEHFRDGDRQTIFSIRLLADRMGKEARMMTENEAYRSIVAQFGQTAADLLGLEESFGLYQKAYEIVSNMSESSQLAFAASVLDENGNPVVDSLPRVDGIGAYATGVPDPKAVFNLALREQYGRLVNQEMQFRGYQVVDPYKQITAVVPFDKITHETMFLPQGLREQIALREAIIDPNSFNAFLKGAHRTTSFFKTTTLVLSVAWQVGDLVSNIIIAQMTGVNVADMLRQMKRVKQEEYGTGWAGFRAMVDPRTDMPTPTSRVRIAQESPIQDIGFSQSERAFLRGQPVREPVPMLSRLSGGRLQYPEAVRGRGITKVSFKINETLNRISRHTYFLELLERELKARDLTLDRVAADGSWRTDPKIKELVFQVANTANDWLGDFADLAMWERKYLTPLFPFYSWTKHIHKVFLMMGREHPQSLRWYIYLGTLNFDPNEDPMNLRYGNPSIFGGAVNLNPFNPFGDVFAGPAASAIQEGNILPAFGLLGPVPRIAGGLAGLDVTKFQRLQRPPGSGAYTESGLEQPRSLLFNPQEALGFGIMQFPLASRLLNVLPGERLPGTQIALGPVTRYQTGEARLKPGTERRIERPGGRLAAVGRVFSVPLIPYQSDEQIDEVMRSAKRRLKTVERLKKRRERYLRSLDD